MNEALFGYFERELAYLRHLASDFARQYPAAAGQLLLRSDQSADPHVERLIESVALLSARIHQKMDDEFPELTDALLTILYPHYLRPIPSLAVVQFQLDPQRAQLPGGFPIPSGSRLHSQPIGGVPCRFRTCYPTTLWPIEVRSVQLEPPPFPSRPTPPTRAAAALRIELACQAGLRFSALTLESLRFFLFGEGAFLAKLYETLFLHTLAVAFRPLRAADVEPVVLDPASCLRQVGFERGHGIIPYPPHAFLGYRLLTELFTFPAKFHFVDFVDLRPVMARMPVREMEIILFFDRLDERILQLVDASSFRLGCVPVVNLFEQMAEPIFVDQRRPEYPIVLDANNPLASEVYSVDQVTGVSPTQSTLNYQPFYQIGPRGLGPEEERAFWYSSRRPSSKDGDRGTDVYLHVVNDRFEPTLPADEVLNVRVTATNRDLPTNLQQLGGRIDFQLESAAPIGRVVTLRPPTQPLRPAQRRGHYWRLISHLSLNHLSIGDPDRARVAFQEILRLYDFSDAQTSPQLAAINRRMIDGILALSARPVVAQIGGPTSGGFGRGTEVTIEFDEENYVGTGLFLVASVLEHFLGQYTTINSFTQLVAKGKQAESSYHDWPPRAGELPLL